MIYVQCKFHNKTIGKAPVQEIFAGTAFHKEHGKAMVITNNLMSFEVRRYAKELGVEVIAKPQLDEFEQLSGGGKKTIRSSIRAYLVY